MFEFIGSAMDGLIFLLNVVIPIGMYIFGIWFWLFRMKWEADDHKLMWLAPIWPVAVFFAVSVAVGSKLGVCEFGEKPEQKEQ